MGKRVKFGVSKVQQLNRIVLPSALLENVGLKIGSDVEMFLDIETNEIIIKRLKK